MKTAIYIEDGVVQLVITPESDFEKNALRSFEEAGEVKARIFTGSFYDCRGGWVRQHGYFKSRNNTYGASGGNNDRSLILINKSKEPEPPVKPCVHDPFGELNGRCPWCIAKEFGIDLRRYAVEDPPPRPGDSEK